MEIIRGTTHTIIEDVPDSDVIICPCCLKDIDSKLAAKLACEERGNCGELDVTHSTLIPQMKYETRRNALVCPECNSAWYTDSVTTKVVNYEAIYESIARGITVGCSVNALMCVVCLSGTFYGVALGMGAINILWCELNTSVFVIILLISTIMYICLAAKYSIECGWR